MKKPVCCGHLGVVWQNKNIFKKTIITNIGQYKTWKYVIRILKVSQLVLEGLLVDYQNQGLCALISIKSENVLLKFLKSLIFFQLYWYKILTDIETYIHTYIYYDKMKLNIEIRFIEDLIDAFKEIFNILNHSLVHFVLI